MLLQKANQGSGLIDSRINEFASIASVYILSVNLFGNGLPHSAA